MYLSRIRTSPDSVVPPTGDLPIQIVITDWRAAMDSTQSRPRNFRKIERWNSVAVPDAVALRAVTNIEKQANGCWISSYSVTNNGYAQIGWSVSKLNGSDGRKVETVLAHRAAWVFQNGQVPIGMTLDHTCKKRRCVNPEHLRLLPNYENARRTSGNDWPIGYCKRGHSSEHLRKYGKSKNASGFTYECSICAVARGRRNRWVMQHPGEPIPDHIAKNTTSEVM